MSSALAIAGVTAVLRDVLNDGMVNHNVSGVLGSSVTVSVLAPDRVVTPNTSEASQINLFLYLVTPNPGWRNERLPTQDGSGRLRLANAPLALDLHYLLSVYSGGDLHAEILLGYAMQLLHEAPVLTRGAIRRALNPSPDVGAALPPALRALADTGLESQIELVKLTPEVLNTEEMSKLWTAMQSNFRPTAAYVASVVLIEARQAARSALPVLSRGAVDPASGRERGIQVLADLLPPLPALIAAVPPARQPAAAIGDIVALQGRHLAGSAREVVLNNDLLGVEVHIPALPPAPEGGDALIEFSLEGQQETLPAGIYRVTARLVRAGETAPRDTNRLVLALAPRMTNLPLAVARGPDGSAAFTIEFTPLLQPGQNALLVLGQQQYAPLPGAVLPAATLDFDIVAAPAGEHLARLSIDGLDSPLLDLSADPPAPPAYNDQRLTIT